MSGAGTIDASGGNTAGGRVGGGGRISLDVTNRDGFTGPLVASGNTGGRISGAGTIYIKESGQQYGHLRVDNVGGDAPTNSTPIRSVGRRVITAATDNGDGTWTVSVDGAPWKATDIQYGWGIDGIDVDLDASETLSAHYVIQSNTTNSITLTTADDLSQYIGKELVGVHTFQTINVLGGAEIDFDTDRLVVIDHAGSSIASGSIIRVGEVDDGTLLTGLGTGGGTLGLRTAITKADMTFNRSGTVTIPGTLNVAGTLSFLKGSVQVLDINAGDIELSAMTLTTRTVNVTNDLSLINNATLRVPTNGGTPYKLTLNVGNQMLIQSGSKLYLRYRGYTGGKYHYTAGPDGSRSSDRYGCHGGNNNNGADCTYGRYEKARFAGSSGYRYTSGGGYVALTAQSLVLDGLIDASGAYNRDQNSSAGGGVHIEVGALSGVGSINVSGTNGGKPGAGGRISIYMDDQTNFTGVLSATGNAGSYGSKSGAGTVYIKESGQAYGHLSTDNNGIDAPTNSTPIRSVGRRVITAATDNGDGTWTVSVDGAPWKATDIQYGWGIDGIDVDLDASETLSAHYVIQSNTTNSITLTTADDLSQYIGKELVGVHTFQTINVTGGAKVTFGSDQIIITESNGLTVDASSALTAGATTVTP